MIRAFSKTFCSSSALQTLKIQSSPHVTCQTVKIRDMLDYRDRQINHPFLFQVQIDNNFLSTDWNIAQSLTYKKILQNIHNFIVQVNENISSIGFRSLQQQKLTQNQTKDFSAKNMLNNLILILKEVKLFLQNFVKNNKQINLQKVKQFQVTLIKDIDYSLQNIFEHLSAYYPQAPPTGATPKMRQIVPNIDRMSNDANDFVVCNKILIQINENYKQIKQDYDKRNKWQQISYKIMYGQGCFKRYIMTVLNRAIQVTRQLHSFDNTTLTKQTVFQMFYEFSQKLFFVNTDKFNEEYSFVNKKIQETYQINSLKNKKNNQTNYKSKTELTQTDQDLKQPKQQVKSAFISKYLFNQDQNYAGDMTSINQSFKNHFDQFKQKYRKKYSIGKKIPNHVNQFTSSDLKAACFSAKNSTILRILTKWAQSLQQIFKFPEKHLQNRVYKLKDIYHKQIELNYHVKNRLIKRLKNIYKNNVKNQLQNLIQKISVYEAQLIFQKQKQQNYCSKRFNEVRKTSSQINQILMQLMTKKVQTLIYYLLQAGHKVAINNQDQKQLNQVNSIYKNINLIVFRIGDLMRSKWTCNQNSFISLVKRLVKLDSNPKMKDKFKLIRIKNKLDTRDRKIQCQLQLSIQNLDTKSKNYYSFCHFIYQLTRGQFGTLAQLAVIVSQHDPIVSSSSTNIYKPKSLIFKEYKHDRIGNQDLESIYRCQQCRQLIINEKRILKQLLCTNCCLKQKEQNKIKRNLNIQFSDQFLMKLIKVKQYKHLKDNNFYIKQQKKQGVFRLMYIWYHSRQLKYYILQIDNQTYPYNQNFSYKNYSFEDYTKKILSKQKVEQFIFQVKDLQQLSKQKKYKSVFQKLNIQTQNINQSKIKQYIIQFQKFRVQKMILQQYQTKSQYLHTGNDQLKFNILCNIIKYNKTGVNSSNQDSLVYLPQKYKKVKIINNFKHLYASHCNFEFQRLEFLQKQFKKAQYIDLSGSKLPRCINLRNINEIEYLNLSNSNLNKIDDSFNELKNIKYLLLSNCKLQTFELDGDENSLNLHKLQLIDLSKNKQLKSIKKLNNISNIINLDCSDCSNLTNIQSFGKLITLKQLNLQNCHSLTNIQTLKYLVHLQVLDLSGCRSLQNISSLSSLLNLKCLDLQYCQKLQNLDVLQHLVNLQNLDLSGCKSIRKIDALQYLKNLKRLDLQYCDTIQNIQPLKSLTNLKFLYMLGCKSLHSIQPLRQLQNIQILDLSYCKSLQSIDTLKYLQNLQQLQISEDIAIESLQALNSFTSLKTLNLSKCPKVKDIKLISKLINLQDLNLSNCYHLTNIEEISKLKNLQILNLNQCESIIDFEPLKYLTSLTKLSLQQCLNLKNINFIASLTKIKKINLSGCKQLNSLQPLGHITQLQQLSLKGCQNIIDFKGVKLMKKIGKLDLSGCKKITKFNVKFEFEQIDSLILNNCDSIQSLNQFQCNINIIQMRNTPRLIKQKVMNKGSIIVL